ncbi:Uncharacterised protein [Mycoplasmopsis citelli]|uniref:Uncharacterized protein n=1 Tax=Mycoplasmopsis citelli TaxID=171281 RepID=A0A449B1U9_9BACT|nr:hypothetical protein [Mycoplasmopsis citelli]VEU74589.1 Uncharacterised protein [Mycoplasmopsis citelli]
MNSFDYTTINLSVGIGLFFLAYALVIYIIFKTRDKNKYVEIFKAVYFKIENILSFKNDLVFDKRFLKGYEIIEKEVVKMNKRFLYAFTISVLIIVAQLTNSIVFVVIDKMEISYFSVLFVTAVTIFSYFYYPVFFKFKKFKQMLEKITFKEIGLLSLNYVEGQIDKNNLKNFRLYNDKTVNILDLIDDHPLDYIEILYFIAAGSEFLSNNSNFNVQNYKMLYDKINELIRENNQ